MRKLLLTFGLIALLGLILLPVSAAPRAQVTTDDLLSFAADAPYAAPFYAAVRLDSGYIETLDGVLAQITAALPEGVVPEGLSLATLLDALSLTLTNTEFNEGLRPLVGDVGAVALGSLDSYLDYDYDNDVLPLAVYLAITDRTITTALVENLLNAQFQPEDVAREDRGDDTLLVVEDLGIFLTISDDTLTFATSPVMLSNNGGLSAFTPFNETFAALPAESYNAVVYVDAAYFSSALLGSTRYLNDQDRLTRLVIGRALGTWAAGATLLSGDTLTGDLALRPGNLAGLEALGIDLTGSTTPVNPTLLARLPADTALAWHGSDVGGVVDLLRRNLDTLSATWLYGLLDAAATDALIDSALHIPNAIMTNATGLTPEQLHTWLDGDYLIGITPNLNYSPFDPSTGLPFDFGIILEASDAAASREAMSILQRDLPLTLRSLMTGQSNFQLQPALINGAQAIIITVLSYNYQQGDYASTDLVLAADDGMFVFGGRGFVESVLANADAAASPFDAAQGVLLPDSTLNLYVAPLPFIGMINSITYYNGQSEQLRVRVPESLLTVLEHSTTSMIVDASGNTVARFTLTLSDDQPGQMEAAQATYEAFVATAEARTGRGSSFAPTQVPTLAAFPTQIPLASPTPFPPPTIPATPIPRADAIPFPDVGETISGVIDAGERDFYSIELTAGESITVSMISPDFDTVVEILDEAGNLVSFNDDRAPGDYNSETTFVVPAAATYTLIARAYSTGMSGSYELTVAEASAVQATPTPRAIQATPTFTPTPSPTRSLTATFVPATEEATAEATAEAAPVPLLIGQGIDGTLPRGGSLNYSLDVDAGDAVTIAATSTDFDTVVEVYNAAGERIAFNDDFNGTNSQIENLTFNRAGTYRILLRSYADAGGGSFTLVVRAASTPPTPTLAPTAVAGTELAYGESAEGNLRTGARDPYTFAGSTGDIITIDMEAAFDTYLRVQDSSGREVTFNDDRGDGTFNSRIARFRLPATGTYTILAGSYNDSGSGAYTLTLTRN
jgi:hypothetical protein